MKRASSSDPSSRKKLKMEEEESEATAEQKVPDLTEESEASAEQKVPMEEESEAAAAEEKKVPDLTEDLIYEILRRADERTLGAAACVSTRWRRLAAEERLWEAVCVKHWAAICSSAAQLRYVVLTLGGFRKIYTSLLHPLVGTRNARSVEAGAGARRKWSKDELQMSLGMMSIGLFGKMSGIQGKKKI